MERDKNGRLQKGHKFLGGGFPKGQKRPYAPKPWNLNKRGTFQKGHDVPQEVRLKVSRTRIETGVARGQRNPFYKDGKSRDPYPAEFRKIKYKILDRDDWKCQWCKVQMTPTRQAGKRWATVHHIDYNKLNNHHLNLISLCNVCNVIVNTERSKWLILFKEMNNGKSI